MTLINHHQPDKVLFTALLSPIHSLTFVVGLIVAHGIDQSPGVFRHVHGFHSSIVIVFTT